MKKVSLLFAIFLSIALFVYFYEMKGGEERQKAKELKESLLRMKGTEVLLIEVQHPDSGPIILEKKDDEWTIIKPIESLADNTVIEGLLSDLELITRERIFIEGGKNSEKYGLLKPKITLRVKTNAKDKTVLIGDDDFTGRKVYVKFLDGANVFLTSDKILSTVDKKLEDLRSKKVLIFEKEKVEAIQIISSILQITLVQKSGDWYIKSPLKERADQSTISDLLSALEFSQAQDFFSEESGKLKSYGLDRPKIQIQVRQKGEDQWRGLDIGFQKEDNYLARNPDRLSVFTVKEDIVKKLTQDVWEFRDKDVIDILQDEVKTLLIRRGQEEISLRRENFKWIVEKPESRGGKEVLGYKFWHLLDDIEFKTFDNWKEKVSPETEVEVVITLQNDSRRVFKFGILSGKYFARKESSGRQGTISKEAFEKLQFKLEDIVSEEPV